MPEANECSRGFNAAAGTYGDRMTAGVIDPAKVVRTALRLYRWLHPGGSAFAAILLVLALGATPRLCKALRSSHHRVLLRGFLAFALDRSMPSLFTR